MADKTLSLPIVEYGNDSASIQALRVPDDNYSYWLPDLEAEIAAAIREYPNMDAEWWLAPSAVLGIVERHLLAAGSVKDRSR